MRIIIDTKEDRKDLGHLINFLKSLSSEEVHTNIFDSESKPAEGLFSMFNSDEGPKQEAPKREEPKGSPRIEILRY